MAKASHPYDFSLPGLPHYDVAYLEMGKPGLWRRPWKLTGNIKEVLFSFLWLLPWLRLIDHQARRQYYNVHWDRLHHKRSYDILRSPGLALISTGSSLSTCGRGPNWHHPWFKAWLYPSFLSTCPEPRRRTKRRRKWRWRRARLHFPSLTRLMGDHQPENRIINHKREHSIQDMRVVTVSPWMLNGSLSQCLSFGRFCFA